MKKISNILLAALALAATVSCNKENDQIIPENNGKVTVLTAHVDNDIESKTTLDGVNVVWSTNDVITAFDVAGKCYNSTKTEILESGAVAKFTVPTDEPVYAVYPAYEEGSEIEMAGGKITATIPTRQNAINGSFDNGMNVEVAKITDKDNIHFKNVGGLLAVKVKGTTHNITSIKIADAAGVYKMTGTVTAGFDASGNVVVDDIAEGESYVDLTGDITVGETYYAVVAPGIYESVTITFEDENGNTATYTKKTTLEVERNSNQLIGGFDIPESKWSKSYVKVTSDDQLMNGGQYLIVYEVAETTGLAFNGSLETLDAVSNTIDVEISGGKIASTETVDASAFTIGIDDGSVLSASGKYIGVTSYSNGLSSSATSDYSHVISIDEDENAVLGIVTTGGTMTLRYNSASDQARFRYYKSGQQPIALYLLEGTGTAPKADPGLAFSTTSFEITLGDTFTAPALTNLNNLTVSYASSNTDVATVDSNTGEVTIIAAGIVTITATFEGNDTYKAGSASYTITVLAPATTVSDVIAGGAGNYTLEGVAVYAASAPNYIIGDETGRMVLYKSGLSLTPGAVINVNGPVVDYNGVLEFSNDATVENTGETVSVDHGTAASPSTDVLSVFQDGYHSAVFVEGSGTQSGRNITVGDITLYINPANAATDNSAVIFSGYVAAYSSSHGTYTFYQTSLAVDESVAAMTVSPKTLTWEADSYDSANAKTITVTLNGAASGYGIEFDDSDAAWYVNDNEAGTITVYPLAANESTTVAKTLTLTIAHSDDAALSEEVVLTQTVAGAITPDPETITFSELNLENGVQYTDPFDGGNFTITFGGGSNDGKYYTTGSGIRTYGGGTITVASTYTIKSIAFTWASSSSAPSSDVANPTGYSTDTATWTGEATSVVFTRPSGSGHWRLQAVTVTYK